LEFNQYYQDELSYLREMGEEFAENYPKLAPFLGTRGSDPDVERILEGFAFIAGRLRQKLDDELPELTESIFSLLWPQYMRPLPSMSILEFTPISSAVSEKKLIRKGVEIDSIPVDGMRCRFQTCFDVEMYPVKISAVEVNTVGLGSSLEISFSSLNDTALDKVDLHNLRIYLHGDVTSVSENYLFLLNHIKEFRIESLSNDEELKLDPASISAGGFADDEQVIPYPDAVADTYRLIHEYFALPEKFRFLNINLGNALKNLGAKSGFKLKFSFDRVFDQQVRINKENFRLNCTPIINLFSRDSDPIRHGSEKSEYIVRPMGNEPHKYDIFTIDNVVGWMQGSNTRREYSPFLSFEHNLQYSDKSSYVFYKLRRQPAVVGRGIDTYISFISSEEKNFSVEREVVSAQMTCTNRNLPDKLKEGDIKTSTGTTPEFATFSNIIPATKSLPPPIDRGLHWNLISSMSSHYTSLLKIESLRSLLSSYNFPAYYNRQAAREHELRMEGIQTSKVEPINLVLQGVAVRGIRINLTANSSKFTCEGELYMLSQVLNRFFAKFSTINSFTQLWVEDIEKGDIYKWKPMNGQQVLL